MLKVIAPDAAGPDFDSVAKIWLRDRKVYDTMLAAQTVPAVSGPIDSDEQTFFDRGKTRFSVVEAQSGRI